MAVRLQGTCSDDQLHRLSYLRTPRASASAGSEENFQFKFIYLSHSSVVKRTLGKSHDFDCAFDYDLIGQILFDFRSHSHLTFLREV